MSKANTQIQAQDHVFNQKEKVTCRYGTNDQHNWQRRSGNYITHLYAYSKPQNDGEIALCGLIVSFDDGSNSVIGETYSSEYVFVDLREDSIRQIQVMVAPATGGSTHPTDYIKAIYVQTMRGETLITKGYKDPNQSGGWTVVMGKADDLPPSKMMLVAVSASSSGDVISSLKFYYKEDALLYQAVTEVIYDSWSVPQFTTLDEIASSTATNMTDAEQHVSITFAESLSTTLSLEFGSTVTIGAEAGGKLAVPFVAEGEVKTSLEIAVDFRIGGEITTSKDI